MPTQIRAAVLFIFFGSLAWLVSLPFRESTESLEPEPATMEVAIERFTRSEGRKPDAAETNRLKQALIDESILFQEALHERYYLRDPLIRKRLVSIMDFLELASGDFDRDLARAYRMQLHLHDEVVRRRMLDLMRDQLVSSESPAFSDKQLLAYYEANKQQLYRRQPVVSFTHILLDQSLLQKLHPGGDVDCESTELIALLKQPFVHGNTFHSVNQRTLETLFGHAFARDVFDKDADEAGQLIESAYGFHCVYIQTRAGTGEHYLDFEQVKPDVAQRMLQVEQQRLLAVKLEQLRQQYRVQK